MRRYMENDEGEIDRILSREEEILPSSGFTVSGMDAVRREAAVPSPIAFPWRRALPGLIIGGVALAVVLVTGVVALARSARTSAAAQFSMPLPSVMPSIFGGGVESAAIWTGLALLMAFVAPKGTSC